MTTEQRTWNTTITVERRSVNGGLPLIKGRAVVFAPALSLDLGGYREMVNPKALDRTLASGTVVRSYLNHNPSFVLGRSDNGTARFWTDSQGLNFEVQPPATTWAADLVQSLERQDIRDASFAFVIPVGGDRWFTKDGVQYRELLDIDLLEAGPVGTGAYPDATSGVRALLEARGLDASRLLTQRPAGRTLTVADCRRMMAEREARWAESDRLHQLALIRRDWGAAPTVRQPITAVERRDYLERIADRCPEIRLSQRIAERERQRGGLPAGAYRGPDGWFRAPE